MSTTARVVVGILVAVCLCGVAGELSAPPQHVVLVSLPLNGHYFPMKSVAEELLRRGHTVTVVTESDAWCRTAARGPRGQTFNCKMIPKTGTFNASLLESVSHMPVLADTFVPMFEELVAHHTKALPLYIAAFDDLFAASPPPTAVFADASTLASNAIAAKFNLPRIQHFPLVTRLTVGPSIWLPQIGQGLPRDMTFGMRFKNFIADTISNVLVTLYLIPRLNAERAEYGIRPFKNLMEASGMYDVTLAPTIWPYDIPQPLCPNVFPLGTLVPDHGVAPMEEDLRRFLESEACSRHGAVYVNFGTLSVISDRLLSELLSLFTNDTFPYCVVFKPNGKYHERVQAAMARSSEMRRGRTVIATYFANAFEIMKHPSTVTFVTHCGDTSLGEAVEAGVPLVGIPFFADQADVCQRLSEVNAGQYLGHKDEVMAADVRRAIDQYALPSPASSPAAAATKASLARLRSMARHLGGAERGAEVLAAHAAYRIGDALICADLDPVILGTTDAATGEILTSNWVQLRALARIMQWDLGFFTVFVPMLALVWAASRVLLWVLRCGGRPARKAKKD